MLRRWSFVLAVLVVTLAVPAAAEPQKSKAMPPEPPALLTVTVPAETETQRARLASALSEDLKAKVAVAARVVAERLSAGGKGLEPLAVAKKAIVDASYFDLTTRSDLDVDVLVCLVMMECAKDTASDLRELLAQMKTSNEAQKIVRLYLTDCKGDKDCARKRPVPAGMTQAQMDQLIDQLASLAETQERMTLLVAGLPTITQRASETNLSTIKNLK